jgi:phosphatidylinositol alpha 1,6-mannosyltransferase
MMRVLMTVGFLGHFGETDGVVTTYRNLLPRFVRSGVPVDVVAYGPRDHVETDGHVRLFVHRPRVPLRVDPARWVDVAFGATRLARELGRLPYTVVQSSTPDPLGLWARGVARRQGCPLVALYHTALGQYAAIRGGHAAGPFAGWVMGRVMEEWLHRYYDQADLVLAPSESTRDEIAATLRPRVSVLSRGVDSQAFHPAKRRRGDSGHVRALYVGRVALEKNLDLLARIFRHRTDVYLTIVGDGPYTAELKAHLPSAQFTGRLTGEALASAYADADFFVFPSRTDTLGNVVLEAMASGLPVVVADSMGPKELVRRDDTGFIAHTDEDFARAIDVFVEQPGRRQAMGRAARGFAETRSWDSIFTQLLRYYDEAGRLRATRRPWRPSIANAAARG